MAGFSYDRVSSAAFPKRDSIDLSYRKRAGVDQVVAPLPAERAMPARSGQSLVERDQKDLACRLEQEQEQEQGHRAAHVEQDSRRDAPSCTEAVEGEVQVTVEAVDAEALTELPNWVRLNYPLFSYFSVNGLLCSPATVTSANGIKDPVPDNPDSAEDGYPSCPAGKGGTEASRYFDFSRLNYQFIASWNAAAMRSLNVEALAEAADASSSVSRAPRVHLPGADGSG